MGPFVISKCNLPYRTEEAFVISKTNSLAGGAGRFEKSPEFPSSEKMSDFYGSELRVVFNGRSECFRKLLLTNFM